MFALQSLIARNGAVCKEYYQPNSTGPIPGVVFASLLAKSPTECGAKPWLTSRIGWQSIVVLLKRRVMCSMKRTSTARSAW
jgi:hypothetical protein